MIISQISCFENTFETLTSVSKVRKASKAEDPRLDIFIRKAIINFTELPFFRRCKTNIGKIKI